MTLGWSSPMSYFPKTCHSHDLRIPFIAFLFLCVLSISVFGQATPAEKQRERGIELYNQGDTKDAINALTDAVREDKNDEVAWRYLGFALNNDHDVKGARKAFESAVKLRDDDAKAHAGLAYTLVLANDTNLARREANRALQFAGPNAELHYIIGLAWLKEHNPTKAVEEAEIATQVDPNYSLGFELKSEALIDVYLQLTFRESIPGSQEPLEKVERDRELFRKAAESLERCLELEPTAPEAKIWREQVKMMRDFVRPEDKTLPEYLSGVAS